MKNEYPKLIINELLAYAGITTNGQNLWDPKIHNESFYPKVISEYELGLGETYMEGWWDCSQLDEFFYRILKSNLDKHIVSNLLNNKIFLLLGIKFFLNDLNGRLFNYQNPLRSFQVAEAHYDIGNDLFNLMLDPELNYSCGYWQNCNTLEAAQTAKLKLICDKLNLQPGQKILDIGCGWGSFARHAAKNYGVSVVGITVSKQQKELADKLTGNLPIEIILQDYRKLQGQYDHIVSIGMFEHVGYKNYQRFLEVANRCLKDNGLFLLHTIGSNASTSRANRWINKYIFPNGMIPSIKQIGHASEKLFMVEDWHNFGAYYDKTLMAWYKNFNDHWDSLQGKYNERFRRMWNYYLLSCAGAFRARYLQLWQIVFSKNGVVGGYQSIR